MPEMAEKIRVDGCFLMTKRLFKLFTVGLLLAVVILKILNWRI